MKVELKFTGTKKDFSEYKDAIINSEFCPFEKLNNDGMICSSEKTSFCSECLESRIEFIEDRWKPKFMERYYFIFSDYSEGSTMRVRKECYDMYSEDLFIERLMKENNLFQTEEEAEKMLSKIKDVMEEGI